MRITQVAGVVAVVGLAAASAAVAQQQDAAANLDRVTVTGSNIPRVQGESDAPIQIIRRDEIRRQSVTTVRQLIDNLTSSNRAALSDINGSLSFAGGATGADLRSLGKQSTLVLLNSRRLAVNGLADYNEAFTNLDTLPVSVVERIEILKQGAAAIYGSDAVAGVINIITRSDFQGIDAQADREQSITSGRFGTTTASLTGGLGNINSDRYNALFNIEAFRRESVMWNDVLGYVNPAVSSPAGIFGFGSRSTYSYPGNVQQNAADPTSLGAAAGCPASQISGGRCLYDRYSRFQAVPASDRLSLFGSGKLQINENLRAFAEANYSHIRTVYVNPFPTYGPDSAPIVWADPRTLAPKIFNFYGLPAGNPLNPTKIDGANFRYRFVDASAERPVTDEQYRLLGGLKGSFGVWDWESAVGYMRSKVQDDQTGNYSESGFRKYVGNPTDADFFNKPDGYHLGQPNNANVVNAIFPNFGNEGKYDQTFVDGKVNRSLMDLPAGPLEFAAGAELRHETFKIAPSQNLEQGDIVGLGISSANGSRTFGALYSELRVPVLKTLEANGALRFDKYPNFNGHFSPKIGFRWTPTNSLLLRATVETGFRAPNLTESANSVKSAFVTGVSDPQRCPQAAKLANDLNAKGDAVRAEQVLTNECSVGFSNLVTNNPNLKPETSRNLSFGLVLEPVKGVSGSVDYYNIERRDEIGTLQINQLLADENNLPAGNTITRRPLANDPTFTAAERKKYGVTTGALLSSTQQFVNTSKTKTSGLDFNLKTDTNLGSMGTFSVEGNATYLIAFAQFSESLGAYGNNLAGRYGFPRLRFYLSGTWDYGPFETNVRANYTSSTSLNQDFDDVTYTTQACADNFGFTPAQCRVDSYMTYDVYFAYSGIKNLRIAAGVKNVFGQKPPADLRTLIDNGGGIIPQEIGDASGRLLKVSLGYTF